MERWKIHETFGCFPQKPNSVPMHRMPNWNTQTKRKCHKFTQIHLDHNEVKVLLITFCQIRNEHSTTVRQMEEQQTEYTITEKFSLNYWPLSIFDWIKWHTAKSKRRNRSPQRAFSTRMVFERECISTPQTFSACREGKRRVVSTTLRLRAIGNDSLNANLGFDSNITFLDVVRNLFSWIPLQPNLWENLKFHLAN